jgi:uncharacterized protein YdaT
MATNQHVVRRADGNWAVKGEGNKRASSLQPTQERAIRDATRIARREGAEVVIHGRDGKIRDKDSYGRDPYPPKDTKH